MSELERTMIKAYKGELKEWRKISELYLDDPDGDRDDPKEIIKLIRSLQTENKELLESLRKA